MPKSKLSTEEIRNLKNTGVSVLNIAEQAGVKEPAVRSRLSPTENRRRMRERYRNFQGEDRKEYIKTQLKRRQEAQDRTVLLAEKIGDLWEDWELDYLREWGGIKTIEELAIHLSRTYRAVERAAGYHKIPLHR